VKPRTGWAGISHAAAGPRRSTWVLIVLFMLTAVTHSLVRPPLAAPTPTTNKIVKNQADPSLRPTPKTTATPPRPSATPTTTATATTTATRLPNSAPTLLPTSAPTTLTTGTATTQAQPPPAGGPQPTATGYPPTTPLP
jgi:hypothetical protein